MSDLDKYDFLNKLTINASEVDLKRAQEMLNYEWIKQHKEWVVELERMIKTKKKLEQDALQGPEAHLRRRLHKGEDKEQGLPSLTTDL